MGRAGVSWVLFDLNGTLLDPATIAQPFGQGPEAERLALGSLDDAIAQAMADTLGGVFRPFPQYLRAGLARRLELEGRDASRLDEAVELAGRMEPFPEAAAALELLASAGFNLGVLTNSATDAAEDALDAAGLLASLAAVIGVDRVETYKPHPLVYEHAAATVAAPPEGICLVAAHGWDLLGARRAGFRTAWVARKERVLLDTVGDPDVRGEDLQEVAAGIVDRLGPARAGAG